jgi:hypothetical protein
MWILSPLFLNNSSTRTTGRWFRPLARAPTCFPCCKQHNSGASVLATYRVCPPPSPFPVSNMFIAVTSLASQGCRAKPSTQRPLAETLPHRHPSLTVDDVRFVPDIQNPTRTSSSFKRSANRRSLGRAAKRIASLTIRRRPTPSAAVALLALAERTAPRWFSKPWAAGARSTTAKRAPNCSAPSNAPSSLSPEAVDSSSLFLPVTGLTFLCSPLSQPRFHHLASRRKGPHGVSRAGWIPFSALRPRPTPAPRPLEPALPPRPSQSRHTDAPGSSCGGWCGPTPGGRKSSRIPSHPVVRRRTPVVGHKHEALVLLFAAAALGPSFARGLLVRANTDNLNSASAVRERQKTHSPIWPQV